MGQQFIYDEKGSTFLYFLLAVFAMILTPVTYLVWPKNLKEEEKRLRNLCNLHGKSKWYKKVQDDFQRRKKKPSFRKILIALGWLFFIYLIYRVSKIENDHVEYDPYEVLGVDREATKGELKKRFRQLLLENHPDKGGDPEKFMKIRKAYEALTDEETMENWKQYGNPDGPQAAEVGIALPKWIVESQNSAVVLGVYMVIFMVILPIVVGTWWNRSIKYSKEQVLLHTTQMYYYFLNKTPNMQLKRALMIFSASFEFSRDYTTKVRAPAPSDNKDVPQLLRTLAYNNVVENVKERPLNHPYSVKARALIYSHLYRLDIPSKLLEDDLEYILSKTSLLIQEMVNCISQLTTMAHWHKANMPRLVTLENIMKISPMMVQGLRETNSPLLQLPYFNEEFVENCYHNRKKPIKSLASLAAMPDAERRQMLRRMGDEEYDTMVLMLQQFPSVRVRAETKVIDDEEVNVITAGSLVTVDLYLTRKSLGALKKGEVRDDNVGECEPLVERPSGKPRGKEKHWGKRNKRPPKFSGPKKAARKPEKASKSADKVETIDAMSKEDGNDPGTDDDNNCEEPKSQEVTHNDEDDDEREWQEMQALIKQEKSAASTSKQTHTVYAPMFPVEKQEWWWAYICDRNRQELLTIPLLITNLVDSTEVELKFPAPQKPGRYSYTVCLRSDSYLDCSRQVDLKLDVKEAKPIEEDHPQWNISDDENSEGNDSEDEGISSEDLSSSDEE